MAHTLWSSSCVEFHISFSSSSSAHIGIDWMHGSVYRKHGSLLRNAIFNCPFTCPAGAPEFHVIHAIPQLESFGIAKQFAVSLCKCSMHKLSVKLTVFMCMHTNGGAACSRERSCGYCLHILCKSRGASPAGIRDVIFLLHLLRHSASSRTLRCVV